MYDMTKGKDIKPHIGIFGRRNNGKSSLINILTGQQIAIVSDTPGTTTDPVKKSMEIKGIGPVVLIDTAGIDDAGDLGNMRVSKSLLTIKSIDLGILLITANEITAFEQNIVKIFIDNSVPFFVVHNKSDLEPVNDRTIQKVKKEWQTEIIDFSTLNDLQLDDLVGMIKNNMPESAYVNPSLIGDLISYGDVVLMITPIDIEAPEGRMILPQMQTIRDILDNDCVAIVLKEREVDAFLRKTAIKPKLAITDSQVFLKAGAAIPEDIPLTSFSIILARQKGDFENYLLGTPKISELKDGDRILMLESCTHHVSCDDIGRIKIPRWISSFTGKKLEFDIVAGLSELPRDIRDYSLVVQCGGCMITRKQLINRLKPAIDAGIPVTNYGMAIAYVQGIYNRAIAPFTKDHPSSTDYL
jgi:[FeFe] hydrogenase H-cluster maturation GTPase HydF